MAKEFSIQRNFFFFVIGPQGPEGRKGNTGDIGPPGLQGNSTNLNL